MEKLAQKLIPNSRAVIIVALLAAMSAGTILFAIWQLFATAFSLMSVALFLASMAFYVFMFQLMIADTKTWNKN